MQELISRAKELLADNTVARVLGWRAGDLPYNILKHRKAWMNSFTMAFAEQI